jgi:hypothetical protein
MLKYWLSAIILAASSLYASLFGQLACYPSVYPSDSIITLLRAEYGQNKKFSKQLEAPALVALSYYPELKDVHISFGPKHIPTTMRAWPKPAYLLYKKQKRRYCIYSNTDTCHGLTFMQRLDFRMQVAVIAHELSHILDYERRSSFGIFIMGIRYKTHNYRIMIENEADMEVIRRDLGDDLCDYTQMIDDDECLSPEYKAYKHRFYFTPADIRSRAKQFRAHVKEELKEVKDRRN